MIKLYIYLPLFPPLATSGLFRIRSIYSGHEECYISIMDQSSPVKQTDKITYDSIKRDTCSRIGAFVPKNGTSAPIEHESVTSRKL